VNPCEFKTEPTSTRRPSANYVGSKSDRATGRQNVVPVAGDVENANPPQDGAVVLSTQSTSIVPWIPCPHVTLVKSSPALITSDASANNPWTLLSIVTRWPSKRVPHHANHPEFHRLVRVQHTTSDYLKMVVVDQRNVDVDERDAGPHH